MYKTKNETMLLILFARVESLLDLVSISSEFLRFGVRKKSFLNKRKFFLSKL